ncbi:MAG: sigma-70 family RNA polymerase sigma factor [Alphaproteobacteria bacterium]|nr:sigma-70 family RNA polymerase sigma factor [Alphaproteobacteria bacterium]
MASTWSKIKGRLDYLALFVFLRTILYRDNPGRIMRNPDKLEKPSFACAYPEVTKTCARLGIYTIPQLLIAVQRAKQDAMARGFRVGQRNISRTALVTLLRGKKEGQNFVNPWNIGRKSFHPTAVLISFALGGHPASLFGPPEELVKLNRRIYEMPTRQRMRIHLLMRRTHNAITGSAGVKCGDISTLAVDPVLQSKTRLTACLDGKSWHTAWGGNPFRKQDGMPKQWAIDLACILNEAVETVFSYSAAEIERRGYGVLPMHDYMPLWYAANMSDPDSDPNKIAEREYQLKNLAELALSCLTGWERKILEQRFYGDMTLEECGNREGVSRERIRQIEGKALKKIRNRLIGVQWSP